MDLIVRVSAGKGFILRVQGLFGATWSGFGTDFFDPFVIRFSSLLRSRTAYCVVSARLVRPHR